IRARASTSGLKAGWAVTSVIRSPFIQTSRPSWIDARYSSPLRIIRPSSVARVSMRNRGAFGKKILTLYCRDFDYTAGGERGRARITPAGEVDPRVCSDNENRPGA